MGAKNMPAMRISTGLTTPPMRWRLPTRGGDVGPLADPDSKKTS